MRQPKRSLTGWSTVSADSSARRSPQPTSIESMARSRALRRSSPSAFSSKTRACSCVSQFPARAPSCFTPLTRRIPAASSGLSRPESAASYASLLTAARRWLTVPAARPKDSKQTRNRRTTARFRAIPHDELLHCELVVSPRMRRAKAVEYRGFRVIQFRKFQSDFPGGLPFVPLAHVSGLRAAVMHNRSVAAGLA